MASQKAVLKSTYLISCLDPQTVQQLYATQPEMSRLYGCIDIAATMHALHVCVIRLCKYSQLVLKNM